MNFKQRVMALSPSQRVALAQKLSNSQRLVAYVVPKPTKDVLSNHELKDLLKSKLPNYMVPAAIVSLDALPRTANGKIDINALPEPQFSSSNIITNAPRTKTEATLLGIWQAVLKLDNIGIHDNFFELGGDSILSIQIVSRAREAGLGLAPNQLFEQPTVAELAAVATGASQVAATQEVVTGEVPLTPIQHWFFEQKMMAPHHWHQAMLVELPMVDSERVQDAITTLWTHHDALRMRFENSQQINADDSNPPEVIQVDLSQLTPTEQSQTIADQGSYLHSSMNLKNGSLFGAILFRRGNHQPDWLLLSAHHLVVDAVSWQILLEDLAKLLTTDLPLPDKTTSFKAWAETLTAQTTIRQSEASFWYSQVEQPTVQLPRDYPNIKLLTEAATENTTVTLSSEDTQLLLQTVPAVYNTQINDALLTALAQTLLQWTGTSTGHVRVEIEAHGREQIVDGLDLSRTVGWFTTTYPVSLYVDAANSDVDNLKSVKEQLRQVPNRGIGYGMLRYLGDAETRQRLAQSSEVLFNYLGQQNNPVSDLTRIPNADVGVLRDSRNQRSYLLEINAWVTDKQLHINWRYDAQMYRADTVQSLANHYLVALKTLIADCTAESGGFTPSDFPDVELGQTELDDFISQLTG
ncbi:MAG: condensation domain-containing protein [Cyanobacteria bacterium P01_D01_bin.156]